MRQGTESLTCFCGAGVAKLLSGKAKSNAIPIAAFMIPSHRAGVIEGPRDGATLAQSAWDLNGREIPAE